MNITITLTAAQEKGLAYVAASPQEWAENVVHVRCQKAIDEIYDMEVARMTADPSITSIPADKDAVVLAADVQTAAQRNAAAEAALGEQPMTKARNLSLLSTVEVGATADQTKADIDALGIAADIAAAGSVVGAEMTWATATAPTGWLEENGAAISRSTYSALFAVIGTTFGVGDGSSTFNLPDARGEFIRGWANGSANDPDRAARTNRGDGTGGDVVGSKQASENKAHVHKIYDNSTYRLYNSTGSWVSVARNDGSDNGDTTSSGGNESRPRNTNRMIIIKY